MQSIVETPQARCLVGIAQADITPPVGIYHRMWGAAKHDRATGVHRPLRASVLMLAPLEKDEGPQRAAAANSNQRMALLVTDHCLLWGTELQALKDFVCSRTGLEQHQLAVLFSHSHSAGLMGLERQNLPGGELIKDYLDRFALQCVELIQAATNRMEPSWISYGQAHCNLARHRDAWDESSKQFVCGLNPEGSSDDTVVVARICDDQQQLRGTLINYACHPTTLAWENTLISPDFVGAMREVVEQNLGGSCLFAQGASGDLGPHEGFVGDPRVADRNGRQLGFAALSSLEALPASGTRYVYQGPVVSGATLGQWRHENLSAADARPKRTWTLSCREVALEYRPELPGKAATLAEREKFLAEERAALAAGNTLAARDARANAERATRILSRIANFPPGEKFPLLVRVLRLGDGAWVFVEGEHYQYLQRELRGRFPNHPIVVCTIVDGSRCIYLPTADTYGKGIYQESIAVLAAGSLEKLTDEIGKQIAEVLAS